MQRDADHRVADPQGGPPQRREAARRDRAPDRPRRRRRDRLRAAASRRSATRPEQALDFIEGLRAAIASGDADADAAGFADALRDAGSIVIVWGEGMLAGDDREQVAESLLGLADVLGLDGREGGGLYEIPRADERPRPPRGRLRRGLRARLSPRPSRAARRTRSARRSRPARSRPLILADVDPIRDFDDPEGWKRALSRRRSSPSASRCSRRSRRAGLRRPPAGREPRREGGHASPIRTAACSGSGPRSPAPAPCDPSGRRSASCSARLGDEPGAGTAGEVFDLIAAEVPFYAGITVDDIGGMGLRWQDRHGLEAAGELDAAEPPPPATPATDGKLRLGTYADLWADHVAEDNPALRFLAVGQTLELGPDDAERLGVEHGQRVEVSADGHSLIATVGLRERMLEGTAFLTRGTATDPAGTLAGADEHRRRPAPRPSPSPSPQRSRRMGTPTAGSGLNRRPRRWSSPSGSPSRGSRADVGFAEASWMHGRQVARHLRRDPRHRADDPAPRAEAARPLSGPLRPQPGRPEGAVAAARRRRQAAQQGGLQARGRGAGPLGDRAGAGHPQRHRDAGDHPVRRRRRRQRRPLRDRRLDRDPLRVRLRLDLLLRPAARRLGIGLEVQLHGGDAVRRPADQLRDLDGACAARRDHDGRLAQPRRHRQCPGRLDLVRDPAVRRLPDLHGRRLRGDEPPAVRPPRGRRRARRRLQHRVRRDALRLLLHGRVHGDGRRLRDRRGDVPRRLARPRARLRSGRVLGCSRRS